MAPRRHRRQQADRVFRNRMSIRYAVNIWTIIEIVGDRVSGVHEHVVGIASHLATIPNLAPR